MSEVYRGFVISEGEYLVQVPDDSQWGFSLCSDDQSWPGGFGAAKNGRTWKPVRREDVPPEVEEAMGWILDAAD